MTASQFGRVSLDLNFLLSDSSLAVGPALLSRLARAQGGLTRRIASTVSALELRGSIDVYLPVVCFGRHAMEVDMSAPKGTKAGGNRRGASKLFGEIASRTSQAAGRTPTFIIAAGVVLVWAVTGPIFHTGWRR
jgi:hypothetical protein